MFVYTTILENKVAGLQPRTPPYSFAARQKSKQKNAPDLLARLRRVPSTDLFAAGNGKNSAAPQTFVVLFRHQKNLFRRRRTG